MRLRISHSSTDRNIPYACILLLLPLELQPAVGFGLSNNTSPFFPIYHQLSPSSHSQHLKISFYFFSASFPGSSSSSRPFQFLNEDLYGHLILLHSLQVTQPTYPLPLYPFYYTVCLHALQNKDYRVVKTATNFPVMSPVCNLTARTRYRYNDKTLFL